MSRSQRSEPQKLDRTFGVFYEKGKLHSEEFNIFLMQF